MVAQEVAPAEAVVAEEVEGGLDHQLEVVAHIQAADLVTDKTEFTIHITILGPLEPERARVSSGARQITTRDLL